jgi:eukaryotic-like serine/threonine-protein kinase
MRGNVNLPNGSIFANDYRIERALHEEEGRAVYLVEQQSTGRLLALKVLSADTMPDENARRKFAEEVRVGAKIQSDHVVDVRAAGVDEELGVPWLVMEYLQGIDLERSIQAAQEFPWPEWDEVLSQICRGLMAAHQVGVVHGGLNPSSIFLAQTVGEEFRVELLDIGMPEAARRQATEEAKRVAWLAPEQLAEGKASPATDVWALGLVAFAMLTGKKYWKAANQESVSLSDLKAEIAEGGTDAASERAKEWGQTVPSSFDAWFERCLRLDADQRFKTMEDAYEAAGDLLTEASAVAEDVVEDKGAKPPPLPSMVQVIADNPKPALYGLLAFALLAVVGGAVLGMFFRSAGVGKNDKVEKAFLNAHKWSRKPKVEIEKGCEKNKAVACHGLGLVYLYGMQGTPKDLTKATQLFQKACDGNEMSACGMLASCYLNGEGVPQDEKKSAQLLQKACDGGHHVSCVDLSELYRSGKGVEKDTAKADALRQKACQAGLQEACN